MKNKLFILIVFLQFFIMSCETNHLYSYEIKDLLTQTQIILKSEDKNIFKLNLEIKGSIVGEAYLLINDVADNSENGLRIDLENEFDKKKLIDWYSNNCFITYIPKQIKKSDTNRIEIKYSFCSF